MFAPQDTLQKIDHIVLALPVPDLSLGVLARLPGPSPGMVVNNSGIRDSHPPILGHVVGVLHLVVPIIPLGIPDLAMLTLANIGPTGQNAPNP